MKELSRAINDRFKPFQMYRAFKFVDVDNSGRRDAAEMLQR